VKNFFPAVIACAEFDTQGGEKFPKKFFSSTSLFSFEGKSGNETVWIARLKWPIQSEAAS